jgi:hypothetical protein
VHTNPGEALLAQILVAGGGSHAILREFIAEPAAKGLADDIKFAVVGTWVVVKVGRRAAGDALDY